LSVDQRPFHSVPLGHYARLSSLLGLSRLAVKLPCAIALYEGWCPCTLREPLGASVTLWEATAPVKLPAWPCLVAGSTALTIRRKSTQEWYFTAASVPPASGTSSGSHLSYAGLASRPDQGVVKLHGVFLSCRG